MAKRSKVYPARIPPLPLRPGRAPLSGRTRLVFMVTIAIAIGIVVVVGVLLATSKTKTPQHVVTIPVADRNASPALVRAAEAVHFHPLTEPGIGLIEDQPASAASPPMSSTLLPVGSQAPGFTLRTPTGTAVSLRAFRGRAVLLEFFATWCPHCGAEGPHLHDLYAKLPHAKIAFVSINADSEDAASVFAYHVYFGFQFPAVLDPGAQTVTFPNHGPAGPVTTRYRVAAFPTFYVIDRHGRIAWRSDGEQPDALLEQEVLQAARG